MIVPWGILEEGCWEEGKSVPKRLSFLLYQVGSVAWDFTSLTGFLSWQGERGLDSGSG